MSKSTDGQITTDLGDGYNILVKFTQLPFFLISQTQGGKFKGCHFVE